MNFCFGFVIDHEKGVEVELIAFVGLSLSPQSRYFNSELAKVVVEASVVTKLNRCMLLDHYYLVFLTLLICDFHLKILKTLVSDDQKRHNSTPDLSSNFTLMYVSLIQLLACWMLAWQSFIDPH